MTGWLDNLPAPLRHAVLVFVGTFLGTLATAVAGAYEGGSGLTAFDWQGNLAHAAVVAVGAVVAAVGLAGVLPPAVGGTSQYGVGSNTAGE
jgi:hypothetical protein